MSLKHRHRLIPSSDLSGLEGIKGLVCVCVYAFHARVCQAECLYLGCLVSSCHLCPHSPGHEVVAPAELYLTLPAPRLLCAFTRYSRWHSLCALVDHTPGPFGMNGKRESASSFHCESTSSFSEEIVLATGLSNVYHDRLSQKQKRNISVFVLL